MSLYYVMNGTWQELVLDTDGSVEPAPPLARVDFRPWEQAIRYACRWKDFRKAGLGVPVSPAGGRRLTYLGSGDFHHLSFLLVEQAALRHPLHLVVLDNHPDNMLFPFGIHCGSWVYHAARLPNVLRVTVIGITSPDIRGAQIFQNHLGLLRAGKVRYWCCAAVPPLWKRLGAADVRGVEPCGRGVAALLMEETPQVPYYLSIDKDVLSPGEVRTNWDQGRFSVQELCELVRRLAPAVCGADITGELSACSYRSGWKRLLTWLDGQTAPPDAAAAAVSREGHGRVNAAIRGSLCESE